MTGILIAVALAAAIAGAVAVFFGLPLDYKGWDPMLIGSGATLLGLAVFVGALAAIHDKLEAILHEIREARRRDA